MTRRLAPPLAPAQPLPSDALVDELRLPVQFAPSRELADWIRATFLEPAGALHNPDHQHLGWATIGCLWTNAINTRQMRTAIATAEMPMPRGTPWVKARQEVQLEGWFGHLPDFVLTFDAVLGADLSDARWCAIVEHELYHCAQAQDEYGSPKFRKDGTPVFGIRGHDVEEFVGVVRRWGAAAAGVGDLVDAAKAGPALEAGWRIGDACGTCLVRAA